MKTVLNFLFFWVVLFLPQLGQAQLLSVSGYVKDFISGAAIENATVYETVSGIGTISNKDGFYRLLLKKGEQNLKISRTGFEPRTASFNLVSDTIVSVNLLPQNMINPKVFAGNKLQNDSGTPEFKPEQEKKRK